MHLYASLEWHDGHVLSGSGGPAAASSGGMRGRGRGAEGWGPGYGGGLRLEGGAGSRGRFLSQDWFCGLHHFAVHQFPSSARTAFLILFRYLLNTRICNFIRYELFVLSNFSNTFAPVESGDQLRRFLKPIKISSCNIFPYANRCMHQQQCCIYYL